MKVLYKNSKIKKICTDEKEANKKLPFAIVEKLFAVINLLSIASNLKDMLAFPQYNLHALKANLSGMYSIYLGKTSGYRLLLTPLDENEMPVKSNDMSIYTTTVCVEIMEVSKHYE